MDSTRFRVDPGTRGALQRLLWRAENISAKTQVPLRDEFLSRQPNSIKGFSAPCNIVHSVRLARTASASSS
jgi:hypothetical protein